MNKFRSRTSPEKLLNLDDGSSATSSSIDFVCGWTCGFIRVSGEIVGGFVLLVPPPLECTLVAGDILACANASALELISGS